MGAEPLTLLFDTPKTIPVSINLVLPGGDGTILSHEKTEEGDSAVARIGEDGGIGMLVEITDIHGKKIWHHDFGYNDSAAPGCRVTVSCHPKLPVILVHYYAMATSGIMITGCSSSRPTARGLLSVSIWPVLQMSSRS